MPWYIDTTIYELKSSLSRFVRALSRGDTDCVVVKRYNRPVALIVPLDNRTKPALDPQIQEDLDMRGRSYWREGHEDSVSRRPPPVPKWF